MSKIFKSATFWILLSGFLLAVLLFFVLPFMGAKTLGARFLWSSIPLVLAALAVLIVSIVRLKKALKGTPKESGVDEALRLARAGGKVAATA